MTPVPKQIRVEDPAYLDWCRCQRCEFCNGWGATGHHVIVKGMGRAQVRDDWAVPACMACHKRCHGQVVVIDGLRLQPISPERQHEAAARARARYLRETAPSSERIPS